MDDEVKVVEKETQDNGELKAPMSILLSDYMDEPENGEEVPEDKDDNIQDDADTKDKKEDMSDNQDAKDANPDKGDASPDAEDDFNSVISALEEFVEKGEKEVTLDPNMVAKIKDIGAKAQEAESLKSELEKVKSQLDSGDSDLKSFIEAFRKDPVKALSDYSESLNLPEPQVVSTMLSSGSVEDQLKVWQENVLIKEIEKEFNLQPGEFEIDKEELWTPKTPSYKWRIETERKERELHQRLADTATQSAKQRQAIIERQERDKQWIKETYFKENEEAYKRLTEEAMSVPEKVFKGELPPEKSPFEYRNLIRGMFFDDFVKIEVAKAVEELKGQYEKLGYTLPEHDNPTDLSKLKGREQKPKDDDTPTFSPLLSTMKKYSN